MSEKVMVFVGTSKGGFIFSSNAKRKKWQTSDIQFKSWNVMHIQMDPRDHGHKQSKCRSFRAPQNPADQLAQWMKHSVLRAVRT